MSLVRAGKSGNRELFEQSVKALIAEERAQQHHTLANKIEESMYKARPQAPGFDERLGSLLIEREARIQFEALVLPNAVRESAEQLIEEHHRSDLLRSYGVEPRSKVLLTGPPGNGKTSLAEAVAYALMLPFFVVRYDGIIGSYLGETSARLRDVFDFVSSRRCVLFFDEFDALGKERGDEHETGEIKRVVNSLIMQIDAIPSHVLVLAASNHEELLDRAIWRRFHAHWVLPKPDRRNIDLFFSALAARNELFQELLRYDVSSSLLGLSYSELESFATDVLRQYILTSPQADLGNIIRKHTARWKARLRDEHARKV